MHTKALLAVLALGAVPAFAGYVVQNGNVCTVYPGTAPKAAKREDLPAVVRREPPIEPIQWPTEEEVDPLKAKTQPERYPRPEPGSKAARTYDRKAALRAENDDLARKSKGSGLPDKRLFEPELYAKRSLEEEQEDDLADDDEPLHEMHEVDVPALVPRQTVDDTPAMLDAFKRCGKDGKVILTEGTFNVRQVMNTTDLRNCEIDILGKLVWSADNIQYWLRSSFGVTYAGRSTAWLFGGNNVSMRGYGKALFDGNGQIWIDQNRDQSNQNGRPISLTVWKGTNIFIDGITWRMAQFWHTFVAHSDNVTMTNLDMSTWSSSQYKAVNTDGFDSWNSKNIRIANWTVKCGDDCVSVKGNSTNVHVSNVTCYESGCACIGSMGSNAGQPDYVSNVLFENIQCRHSSNAAWIKTYPGTGYVKNITFRNFAISEVDQPIYVTPCIYSGNNCDGSRIPITDVTWENITGTSRWNVAAGIYCSKNAKCTGFKFSGINIKPAAGGTARVLCANFNQDTAGLACTGTCPANWPQQLRGNKN